MKIQKFLDDVMASKKKLDEHVQTLMMFIKNPDAASLDERWAAFLKISSLLPVELYGDGFVDDLGDNITLYDEFYIERHETVDYADFWYRVKEHFEHKGSETLDMWRERVLAAGKGGFTYDW